MDVLKVELCINLMEAGQTLRFLVVGGVGAFVEETKFCARAGQADFRTLPCVSKCSSPTLLKQLSVLMILLVFKVRIADEIVALCRCALCTLMCVSFHLAKEAVRHYSKWQSVLRCTPFVLQAPG